MYDIGTVKVIVDDRDQKNRSLFVSVLEEYDVPYHMVQGPYFQDTIATVVKFEDGGMLTSPHTLRGRLKTA